jgi:hypothetical protein
MFAISVPNHHFCIQYCVDNLTEYWGGGGWVGLTLERKTTLYRNHGKCSVDVSELYREGLLFEWAEISVGIATRYELDGPGTEYRQGRDYPHSSRPALGPIQPPIQWVPRLCGGRGGGKPAGAWC